MNSRFFHSVLFLFLCLELMGHTGGKEQFTCPLDKTEFAAWQDYSGTSFGCQLDLKAIGPTAAPWAMAQCPNCKLPLYQREFSQAELSSLKEIVYGNRFKNDPLTSNSYYALGVILEELRSDPYEIGWSYLHASWQFEENSSTHYPHIAGCAKYWFDTAFASFHDRQDKQEEAQLSYYIGIELSRRCKDFDSAKVRIHSCPDFEDSKLTWFKEALATQTDLVADKDSDIHEMKQSSSAPRRKSGLLVPSISVVSFAQGFFPVIGALAFWYMRRLLIQNRIRLRSAIVVLLLCPLTLVGVLYQNVLYVEWNVSVLIIIIVLLQYLVYQNTVSLSRRLK